MLCTDACIVCVCVGRFSEALNASHGRDAGTILLFFMFYSLLFLLLLLFQCSTQEPLVTASGEPLLALIFDARMSPSRRLRLSTSSAAAGMLWSDAGVKPPTRWGSRTRHPRRLWLQVRPGIRKMGLEMSPFVWCKL